MINKQNIEDNPESEHPGQEDKNETKPQNQVDISIQ